MTVESGEACGGRETFGAASVRAPDCEQREGCRGTQGEVDPAYCQPYVRLRVNGSESHREARRRGAAAQKRTGCCRPIGEPTS